MRGPRHLPVLPKGDPALSSDESRIRSKSFGKYWLRIVSFWVVNGKSRVGRRGENKDGVTWMSIVVGKNPTVHQELLLDGVIRKEGFLRNGE